MAVQLVAQGFQTGDQRGQGEGIVKIPADLAEGQAEPLQNAEGAYFDKGVDGVIAVAGGTVLDVRRDQAELLVVEKGAAGDAQRPRHLADGKQVVVFFHKTLP